jgi:hypothetical protein
VPVSSYVLLALALLLLWFPRNWLRLGMRVTPKPPRKYNQSKVERDPHDQSVKPAVEVLKSRNWLDLFRGLVGGVALMSVIERHTDVADDATIRLACVLTALILSVISQMIRLEGRLTLFAPIFFLQGLTFGVTGGVVGLIVMCGTWALSPVLPSAGAMLFVQGAVALCLSMLIKTADPVLGMAMAGVTWVPVIVSVLLQKRLAATFDKKLKIVPRDARDD